MSGLRLLKVQELEEELAKRGLDTSGAKPKLVWVSNHWILLSLLF